MGSTEYYTRQVIDDLEGQGTSIIRRKYARIEVENQGDMKAPWSDHIERTFRDRGWETSNNVFYHHHELVKDVREFSRKVRSESRPVVSKGVLTQEIAGIDWPSGDWGKIIDDTMKDEGWEIDEDAGIYYLPPTELVSESSLSYYLMSSFEVPS